MGEIATVPIFTDHTALVVRTQFRLDLELLEPISIKILRV